MANKRDVELLLRATDLSSKPLSEVAEAVKRLGQRLNEQESAAAKGEATLRELSNTLGQLNEASKALAGQNAAIERYRDLGNQLESAKAKAEAAASALATLRTTTEGNEKATAAQTRELNRAEAAVNRSVADVQKRTAALEKQASILEQAGVDVSDLATAEQQLVTSAREVGQARAQATAAIEQYDIRLRQHRAEVKAAADAEKAAAAAVKEAAAAEEELTRRAQAARDQARAKAAAQDALAAEKARQWAVDYERFWVSALDDVEAKRREEAAVAQFQEKLKAARAKEAAAEYERWWISALSDVEAKQAAVNKRLAEQAAAFKANADAIHRAARAASGFTQAQDALAGKQAGYAGRPGFLGLRPYELQNLSFQINDIFTQLGSGTSLTQALSQQGGQIFQLFQSRLTGLIRVLPHLTVIVAALGTTVAALVRLRNTAESVREFSSQLTLSADGLRYSSEEIVRTQRELQRLGLGFDEAGEALRKFIAVGVSQSQLQDFVITADKLAKVMQKDLKTVVDEMASAFTGNFDALEKLDKQYNVFTASQLATIRAAFEERGAVEGRAQAYSILQRRVEEAGKTLSGPLRKAFREARSAWLDFLDAIGNSSVGQALFTTLALGAKGLEEAAKALSGVLRSVASQDPLADRLAAERSELEKLLRARDALRNGSGIWRPDAGALQQIETAIAARTLNIDFIERTMRQRDLNAETEKGNKIAADNAAATEAQRKAGERFLRNQQDAIDMSRGVNNARRIELAGLKAYNDALGEGADAASAETAKQRAAAEERRKISEELKGRSESLEQQLAQILAQGDKAQRESLQARLAAIDESFRSASIKLAEFRRMGGTQIGGLSLADYEARLASQREILKQNETIKFFEENINDLGKAREAIFKDVTDAVAAGNKTAAQGYAEARAAADELNPKIKALAADALKFAKAFAEVRPGPQIMAFIAQMERQVRQAEDGPRTALGTQTEAIAKAQMDAINQRLATRRDLEQAWQNLADKGVVTQSEASRQIVAAYEEMNGELLELIENMEQFLSVAGDALPAGRLDLFRAKLAEVRSDLRSLDPATRRLVAVMEQSFANNAVNALDSVARAIGGAIAGTKSWADAWREVGAAALQFFADLLRDIAKAILQAQILAAIKAMTGMVFHEGGVVGSSGAKRTLAGPSWFAAPRYHSGRVGVGMAPDEVRAILQRGEEVLSRDDPRNILNGGKGASSGAESAGSAGIKQVLVMDQAQIPAAMQSSGGERVVLTHIRANAATIRSILGV